MCRRPIRECVSSIRYKGEILCQKTDTFLQAGFVEVSVISFIIIFSSTKYLLRILLFSLRKEAIFSSDEPGKTQFVYHVCL